ncbi:MAG TPA: hypothetical protein VHZ97_09100 [Pseudonocardiaceae bacterium]|nr:hypothetical protein [Pseudonocardiaceae bacterium]
MIDHAPHSLLRKIAVTALVGALCFPITNVFFSSIGQQLAMSAAAGAVILIVQFLVDVDHRLGSLEHKQTESTHATRDLVAKGFRNINEATRLFGDIESIGLKTDVITQMINKAAQINPTKSPLVSRFVLREMDNMAEFLHGVANKHLGYPGEDRNWLLSLSNSAQESIDAVSLPAVDAGGEVFHSGFWDSDLGRRYLELQHDAVRRGVRVRRVFVIERPDLVDHADVLRTCEEQARLRLDVRLLFGAALPKTTSSYDFILFDDQASYEVMAGTPTKDGSNPMILETQLVLDEEKLAERRKTYERLWESAQPLREVQSFGRR